MAAKITLTDPDTGRALTDRELLLGQEEARRQDAAALEYVADQQARALGMSAFCCTFYDALMQDELHRFTRSDILELLGRVLEGR